MTEQGNGGRHFRGAPITRGELRARIRDRGQDWGGFVSRMFDEVAPRYDRFTRLFSLGMDASWKSYLVGAIPHSLDGGTAVDLACGTGDLGDALAKRLPRCYVLGVDGSRLMLAEGNRRRSSGTGSDPRHGAVAADIQMLPIAEESAAVALAGYAFRNVADMPAALNEAARVLHPGGVLAVLDFYRPKNSLWSWVFLLYLQCAGALVGWLWHRSPAVYEYIAHSIRRYTTADQFSDALRSAGFSLLNERSWLGGGIAVHLAARDELPDSV